MGSPPRRVAHRMNAADLETFAGVRAKIRQSFHFAIFSDAAARQHLLFFRSADDADEFRLAFAAAESEAVLVAMEDAAAAADFRLGVRRPEAARVCQE